MACSHDEGASETAFCHHHAGFWSPCQTLPYIWSNVGTPTQLQGSIASDSRYCIMEETPHMCTQGSLDEEKFSSLQKFIDIRLQRSHLLWAIVHILHHFKESEDLTGHLTRKNVFQPFVQ